MDDLDRLDVLLAESISPTLVLAAIQAASRTMIFTGRLMVDWGAGLQRLGVRVLAGAATSERTRLIHRH